MLYAAPTHLAKIILDVTCTWYSICMLVAGAAEHSTQHEPKVGCGTRALRSIRAVYMHSQFVGAYLKGSCIFRHT